MRQSSFRLSACAAAVALLAACAERPPAPPAAASKTAAIDGVYEGSASGSCGTGQAATVNVKDGRFTLTVMPGLRLQGLADRDGTLSATQPNEDGRAINFTGRIDGPKLRGGSYNGRCAFAFTMQRTS